MWITFVYASRGFISHRVRTGLRPAFSVVGFELQASVPSPSGAIINEDSCVIRWIRSRVKSTDYEQQSNAFEQKGNGQAEDSQNGQNPGKSKVDSALLRKLRIYVLLIGGLSFLMSLIALSVLPMGQVNMEDVDSFLTRPSIDISLFFDKYLKAGEVRRIIFCPDHSRAVAFLHEGAVIDGKKVHEPIVVIAYTQGAQQFWADVRREESVMGISLSDGVRLDVYKGIKTIRVIEFVIGVLILAWLGIQYGRLLQQRMISWKKKN